MVRTSMRIVCAMVFSIALSLGIGVSETQGPPSPSPTHAVFGPSGTCETTTTGCYWSGYVKTGVKDAYSSISGSWKVPSIPTSTTPTYSAAWVGIDGRTNSTLLQAGSESDYYGGKFHYDAWVEVYPALPKVVFNVVPGDLIGAGVYRYSGSNLWRIYVYDETRLGMGSHYLFDEDINYTGPADSEEWILEAPKVMNHPTMLAKYGSVTFLAGQAGLLHLSSDSRVFMVNSSHQVISAPSAPCIGTYNVEFSVAYGSKPPPRPTCS